MRIDIATLFTDMCDSVTHTSIIGRGIKNGFIEIHSHDIRDYADNKHNRVDDKPYGGGTGMVMMAEPVYSCISDIKSKHEGKPRIIYMSPQGELLTQEKVKELAAEPWLILLCGHYEGIDQRVLDELDCEELSVGDYVLTGGELPALIVADAVARLQPGVLPNEDAYSIESHYSGLLEYPQYTRPEEWHSRKVPEALLTGDHKSVNVWQQREALRITSEKRPDMLSEYYKQSLYSLWYEFLDEKGLPDTLTWEIIERFGQTDDESEKILKMIIRGKKRAIIRPEKSRSTFLPQKGSFSIAADHYGIPCAIIKTLSTRIVQLDEVTEEMARKDSGNSDVEAWRENFIEHTAGYYEGMPLLYEEFRVEYKRKNKD